jgi:Arc/MetJ-type ribon-helix-helix transcriptional regulator
MTIHLPENLETSIREAVDSGQFASMDDAISEAVRLLLRQRSRSEAEPGKAGDQAASSSKPIWEVAAEIRQGIPKEEWAKLPPDGAAQHDHYLYGTPKRPAR